MTIYLIQRNEAREDVDGRDYINSKVDKNYGYFTNKEEAEAFALKLGEGPLRDWEEALAKYEAQVAAYNEERDRARALGFRPDRDFPSRSWMLGDKPIPYDVVTVEPHGTVM